MRFFLGGLGALGEGWVGTNGVGVEVPHPVASGATYEGRDRGVNPISVVTECNWQSKGCQRPVNSDSHADPEG